MHLQIKLIFLTAMLVPYSALLAQQSLNCSGGNSTGIGGSISFSIGEVFFETRTLNDTNFADGIQQAYEVSLVNAIEENSSNISVSVFPNPHSEILILECKAPLTSTLSYRLTDASGRLLISAPISSSYLSIETASLPAALYFLYVVSAASTEPSSVFKIIKN